MRLSLELIVVAIVILIAGVVVITIFTGGIENFMRIFGFYSDEQIKQGMCANACSSFCMFHPEKASGEWGTTPGLEDPKYKDVPIGCRTVYGNCVCKTPLTQ
ncbi:MAG: hypothetical protein KAW40_03725 [Candidatus Aenigmarchaeota archaeon]|nr:hypothetical protein [Candidatus Aenigmarchaeota archaeon]